MIAIIDYGQGNLRSIAAACRFVGLDAVVTPSESKVWSAEAIILPGVGAFRSAMARLSDTGVTASLLHAISKGTPVLGICLGMQLLMDWSDENGGIQGLGYFKGEARRLSDAAPVPNVGWRPIRPCEGVSWSGSLLEATEPSTPFYFAHSYHCIPSDPDDWLAYSDHGPHLNPNDVGETSICAAVKRGNVMGVQFHPEKSGPAGLNLLRRFGAMVEAKERAA